MAQTKRKPAAKKKPAAKRVSGETALKHDRRRRQLWSVVLFALGVLLICFSFIGNSEAENPSVWDAIHTFFRGIFGASVFLIGPVVIYAAIMISADKGKSTLTAKVFQLTLIILLLCSAMQIFFVGSIGNEGEDFAACFGTVYEQGTTLSGGGICGMLLGYPLLLFGQVGAGIIIVLIIFVMVMLIANISLIDLFRLIAKPFLKLFGYTKDKREQYREESEIVRAEYERAEAERLKAEEKAAKLSPKTEKLSEKTKAELEAEARRKRFADIEKATENTVSTIAAENKADAKGKQGDDLFDNLPPRKPNPAIEKIADGKTLKREIQEYNGEVYVGVQLGMNEAEKAAAAGALKTAETPPAEVVSESSAVSTEEVPAASETAKNADESAEEYTVEPADKETVDAVSEAISQYKAEIAAKKAAAETNERVIDTVVKTDENGQGRFEEIVAQAEQYKLPPIELLNDIVPERADAEVAAELEANSNTLVETLKSFGVMTKIVGVCRGPSVTRYELQPAAGVKISKITGLVDDIALNLATAGVRIEAPIPNKAAVGIEVPNKKTETVPFRALIDSDAFKNAKGKLCAVLGKDISGETIIADIAKMPHILIAGTTGSGKSVCVNSIIMSILYRSTPDEVRLLMIDPKAVEFMIYNGIPHLLIPVVTDPKKASGALAWAVTEMLNRYKLFADNNVRDISGYNSLAKGNDEIKPMPQIVIFIDELADLMMASPGEVEDSICRLAQMARAAGMHLVIATQRPSVNVVTGVIKANIPSRIALKVASQVDSRTILDGAGAEKLLGKGDMLYFPVGMPKPTRVQGCWVSDKEVERVVDFIKNSFILDYDDNVIQEIERRAELAASNEKKEKEADSGDIDSNDEKLDEAIEAVIEAGQASTSYLQRKLKLGYGRAARLIDVMETMGIVGPFEGAKPRQVIMTKQEWYERKLNQQ